MSDVVNPFRFVFPTFEPGDSPPGTATSLHSAWFAAQQLGFECLQQQKHLSPSPPPDRHCDQHRLMHSSYGQLLSQGVNVTGRLHPVPRLRTRGAMPALPHTRFHGVRKDKFVFTPYFNFLIWVAFFPYSSNTNCNTDKESDKVQGETRVLLVAPNNVTRVYVTSISLYGRAEHTKAD